MHISMKKALLFATASIQIITGSISNIVFNFYTRGCIQKSFSFLRKVICMDARSTFQQCRLHKKISPRRAAMRYDTKWNDVTVTVNSWLNSMDNKLKSAVDITASVHVLIELQCKRSCRVRDVYDERMRKGERENQNRIGGRI